MILIYYDCNYYFDYQHELYYKCPLRIFKSDIINK